jgi:hypothetical protein
VKLSQNNHVSWAKSARISPAEEHGIFGHFGIERLALSRFEGGPEHVVPEPITKHVAVLVAFEPMGQPGVKRNYREQGQCDG